MKIYAAGLVFLVLSVGPFIWAQHPTDELFLSPTDVHQVSHMISGLAEATNRGPEATRAYLATQQLSYQKFHQLLTDIAVAYTAIRLQEYLKQVESLVDPKTANSQYRAHLDQTRKQLADLTSQYKKATRNGRSALDINEEVVLKHRSEVESILVDMRNGNPESLPKGIQPTVKPE